MFQKQEKFNIATDYNINYSDLSFGKELGEGDLASFTKEHGALTMWLLKNYV